MSDNNDTLSRKRKAPPLVEELQEERKFKEQHAEIEALFGRDDDPDPFAALRNQKRPRYEHKDGRFRAADSGTDGDEEDDDDDEDEDANNHMLEEQQRRRQGVEHRGALDRILRQVDEADAKDRNAHEEAAAAALHRFDYLRGPDINEIQADIEPPVNYTKLEDDAWMRDDPCKDSKECFLCMFKGSSTPVRNLQLMISENYGRVSNEQLAKQIQTLYQNTVQKPSLAEYGEEGKLPDWSWRSIIEHVEIHAPRPIGMVHRTIKDLNNMIHIVRDNMLCIVEPDGRKTLDLKSTNLLLKLNNQLGNSISKLERISMR